MLIIYTITGVVLDIIAVLTEDVIPIPLKIIHHSKLFLQMTASGYIIYPHWQYEILSSLI